MAVNGTRLLVTGLVLIVAGLMADVAHGDMVTAIGCVLAVAGLLVPQTSRQRPQGGTNAASVVPGPQRELWQRERVRERRVRYWPWEDPDRRP